MTTPPPPYPAPGPSPDVPQPGRPAVPAQSGGDLPGAAPPGPVPATGYQVPPGYSPPPAYPYQPAPTSPSGEPLAEFDKRLIAYIVDVLILGAVAIVVVVPIYFCVALAVLQPTTTVNGEAVDGPVRASAIVALLGLWFALLVLLMVLQYVYFVEMVLRGGGQTYGKRVAKVRIAPVNPGQPLTRRHLAIRYFATLGMGLVPALGWVDGLFQLWDKPYRQCLHDKAATTVVVRLST